MTNIIEIIDGESRQPQYKLPQPINFSIAAGEQMALVGANGSGKSIIIGAVMGAIPLKGIGVRYNFGEGSSNKVSESVKYLAFRDSYGTADKSYYHQQRWNSFDREDQPIVSDMLPASDNEDLKATLFELFNIDAMLSKEMILLSSGELRKFQLTKALLSDPKLLILEDPFIGLDAKTRQQLRDLLEVLTTKRSLQVIIVLSNGSDIPPFVTAVVEMRGGVCGAKMSREEYLKSIPAVPDKPLSDADIQRIIDLPVTASEHKSDSIIELNNISIRYGEHTILRDLTWQMQRGEQWVLSGENGAGKSTLLSLICADIPQGYACDLKLFGRKRGSGESIWDIKRHIGYVSPEMHRAYCTSAPCIEIVASGLHDTIGLYKRMKDHESDVCEFWMDIFGIKQLRDCDFTRISSGEQRLVLLARAFVKDPELLILDEPLHGLDPYNRRRALQIIETFCRRQSKSLLFVSHYKEEWPQTITDSLHLTKRLRD
ncbi:MAG: ATP-binding cassette domain-containing protein [Rikenellaceae bacterium]